ncbi:hypothetical protein, partial [uncultured Nevskia sp.]|uniref:hypothetical protein n=1 Tax=uncultured Nevskia sp. TaxID=228950 RepID=UPI0026006E90
MANRYLTVQVTGHVDQRHHSIIMADILSPADNHTILVHSFVRRIAQRYFTFVAARIALVIGRWFVLIQSAKHLDKIDFAALAAALSVAELLRALADGGVDNFSYSRLGGANCRVRVTVRTAFFFRAVIATILMVIGAAVHYFLVGELRVLPVFLLIGITLAQTTSIALLQKEAQFSRLATLVGITLVASLAVNLTVLLSPAQLGLMSMLLIAPDAVAASAGLVLASPAISKMLAQWRRARRPALSILRSIASKLAPISLVTMLVMIYSRLDVTLVLPLLGSIAQADYSAGWRLTEPLFLFLSIASFALLAELGSVSSNNAQVLGTVLTKPAAILPMIGLLAIALIAVFVVRFVAGNWIGLSAEASLLAGILAGGIPFRVANTLISTVLQRLARFDRVLVASI